MADARPMGMRLLALIATLATTAAAEPRRPVFTPACDHDGWTCHDNFPAIDKQTIVNVVTRGDTLVLEFISVNSSRVLRREVVFDAGKIQRSDRFNRELRRFRPMTLDGEVYRNGTVELTIRYCEDATCRTTYRVRRRRR